MGTKGTMNDMAQHRPVMKSAIKERVWLTQLWDLIQEKKSEEQPSYRVPNRPGISGDTDSWAPP